ncbi:unnamed protein product, partial [Laminaria digitata]
PERAVVLEAPGTCAAVKWPGVERSMSLRRIRRTLREDDGDEEEVALSPEVVASRSKSKRRLITSDEDDDDDDHVGDHD